MSNCSRRQSLFAAAEEKTGSGINLCLTQTTDRCKNKKPTKKPTHPNNTHTHTINKRKKTHPARFKPPVPSRVYFSPPPSRKKNKSLTALLRPPTNVRCAAKPPPLRALPVPPRSACQPARAREPAPPTSPLPSAPAALRMRRSHGSILLNRALSLCAPHCPFKEKGRAGSLGGGRCCPL